MRKNKIEIVVELDEKNVPEKLEWAASGSADPQAFAPIKALLLSLWDGTEKTALRLDLWTKDMMIDEMADFFVQTLLTMADTYERAVSASPLHEDIRKFAREFQKKTAKGG